MIYQKRKSNADYLASVGYQSQTSTNPGIGIQSSSHRISTGLRVNKNISDRSAFNLATGGHLLVKNGDNSMIGGGVYAETGIVISAPEGDYAVLSRIEYNSYNDEASGTQKGFLTTKAGASYKSSINQTKFQAFYDPVAKNFNQENPESMRSIIGVNGTVDLIRPKKEEKPKDFFKYKDLD